jgi:hypothetical protein
MTKLEKAKRDEAIAFERWLHPDETMVQIWSDKYKHIVWSTYEEAYSKFKRSTKKGHK